jgi:bifunctional non-homologous end joining protein LigD
MTGAAADLSPARFDAGVVAGAKPAPFPGFVEPCHPTLREQAPPGVRWIHEIKFDGYRTQAHLRNGRPAIYTLHAYCAVGKNQRSRAGLDRTEGYCPIRFRKKARG